MSFGQSGQYFSEFHQPTKCNGLGDFLFTGLLPERARGSIGRIRVLEVIVEAKDINISTVGRKTGLTHTSVDRHVNTLKELGLIEDTMWPGGIRMLKPAFQSLTIVLKKGFETKFRATPP